MAEHWSRRLCAKLKEKGWTAAELSRRSGVDVDLIYKYLKGKVEAPRGRTLANLAKALGVNPLWLSHEVNQPIPGPIISELRRSVPIIPLSALSGLKKLSDLPTLIAGAEEIAMPGDAGPRAIAVTLDDDSMAPKFPVGSMVICDPDAPVVPGKYVIAISTLANRPVFRRFKATAAGSAWGVLVAENTDFPPISFKSDKDGLIVGRATMIFHKI